jgi:N-acetylmuramoyl-L-alanine amidase
MNDAAGTTEVKWLTTPNIDREHGRNSNVYDAAIGHPTLQEKRAFLEKLKQIVPPIAAKHRMPASAIIAMACVESGYGFTRTARLANNYFGMKSYIPSEIKWQLEGQPEEDKGQPVLENLGKDRIIFDEPRRTDNWYMSFSSIEQCFDAFIVGWFVQDKYKRGYAKDCENYRINRKTMPKWEASFQWLHDIAERGYCHLGGDIYVSKLKPVIDAEKLYLLDYELDTKPAPSKVKRVHLDPGHSQSRRGASGLPPDYAREDVLNLLQAKIIQQDLAEAGIESVIDDPDPDDRDAIGQRAKGYDAHVSLHHNAFDRRQHYVTCMVTRTAKKSSIELAGVISKAVATSLSIPNFGGTSGLPGVYEANLTVLLAAERACMGPCVLVESYFIDAISSIAVAERMSTIAAHAIAQEIVSYLSKS